MRGRSFLRLVYVRRAVLADVALFRHALSGGSERQLNVIAGLGHMRCSQSATLQQKSGAPIVLIFL